MPDLALSGPPSGSAILGLYSAVGQPGWVWWNSAAGGCGLTNATTDRSSWIGNPGDSLVGCGSLRRLRDRRVHPGLRTGIRIGQRRLNLLLRLGSRSRTGFRKETRGVGQAGPDGFLLTRVAALRRKDRIGSQ